MVFEGHHAHPSLAVCGPRHGRTSSADVLAVGDLAEVPLSTIPPGRIVTLSVELLSL